LENRGKGIGKREEVVWDAKMTTFVGCRYDREHTLMGREGRKKKWQSDHGAGHREVRGLEKGGGE